MKTMLLVLLGFGLLMVSCEKRNDDPDDFSITGKSFDQRILGKWMRSYSTRDANNGITLWTDSLIFENDNLGNQKIYQFSELTVKTPFQFYSEKNTLVIRVEKDLTKWSYSIRNDSLFLTTYLPLNSSRVVVRAYLKDK